MAPPEKKAVEAGHFQREKPGIVQRSPAFAFVICITVKMKWIGTK
jgi:hypothetical protein